ncbi:protein-glutamine gamma-glutamyltransferase [Sporosarcina sp. Marseille-Q4063]|uniref:protein-glutamine gamma-glutamyltransferase n=1 Tax=Sporosarcina sp. Marseille-Q4063 TaxID=2810514 RepID=UPI001BAF516B|nr:protein-glutamine gamma-glutamyltransferase [Sporosarcina sp. Marseille-Q4063]QUW21456.1 protein-glutamine gamma-glutamyltransferase [Sporosarcina sp. Marseille-Q4063]
MIQIGEKSFQQNDLRPTDKMESTILQRINESSTVYSYQSIAELSYELKLRKSIIDSAKAMDLSNVRFEVFKNSRCNPGYWILTNVGGFQLRAGVKPSDAIRDIYMNSSRYAFECATAMVIIYYHAFLNLIGDDLFNQLFQDIYLYSWHADSDLGLKAYHTRDFIPGDVVYFNNPDFDPKRPQWRGENAVVLGDGTYFGHGFGVQTAEQMIRTLNRSRKRESNRSAYLSNLVARPSFKQLSDTLVVRQVYSIPKYQPTVVHHGDSSISFDQYMFI